ncbi:PH and SEC7 domain-containing protein-like [Palaemon carinicauda]|uniref:PH and SEC7 domain-containing protein-like n=1 Tax=Palaemon carinicauda TaxID=392227 RepID=UPI0035B5F5F0
MSDNGYGGTLGGGGGGGGGCGDSSSTERSSHNSSTFLLSDSNRSHARSGVVGPQAPTPAPQVTSWRTTPILEALTRPAQLRSPTLAARRLTRWKRIASDDMEKVMMEEKDDVGGSQPEGGVESNTFDGEDADTEETLGDSTDSGLLGGGVPAKDKGSGVPPLSDSEDDSARVLIHPQEAYR